MKKTFALFLRFFILPIASCFLERVEGRENIPSKGGFILVANHINSSDHYFLGAAFRKRMEDIYFIGATDVRFVKWYNAIIYYLAETIRVDRNHVNRKAVLEKAREYLEKGKIIAIYPEGDTNRGKNLLRGKTGAAELALKTGLPVIPVGMSSKRKGITKKRIIKIGKPLYFEKTTELSQEILRKTTKKIMIAISSLSGKPYPYGKEQ